jgi:hypothetical protein
MENDGPAATWRECRPQAPWPLRGSGSGSPFRGDRSTWRTRRSRFPSFLLLTGVAFAFTKRSPVYFRRSECVSRPSLKKHHIGKGTCFSVFQKGRFCLDYPYEGRSIGVRLQLADGLTACSSSTDGTACLFPACKCCFLPSF